MHKKKKESLSHLRCREAVGVDSIAAGMIHYMLYLSANAIQNMQMWNCMRTRVLVDIGNRFSSDRVRLAPWPTGGASH
jgi:hypothetical protein